MNNLPDRFRDKISPEPNSGCWLWTAATSNVGYSVYSINRKLVYGHRFSYESLVGPIPKGLDIDHLCRVRCCVNPDHLEPVTRRENVIRGHRWNGHKRPTRCPSGHLYSGDNLYINKLGRYVCRICTKAARKKWRDKITNNDPGA